MAEGTVDYIIIGGGSAGCVLAARLSENPYISVALLEAGPADSSALIHCPAGVAVMAQTGQANWHFNTVAQPGLNGRNGYQPRGKVLGGSSSVNAMIYIRGQREDYNAWAAQGNVGWTYDEVLPYFKKAEANTRGANAFHGGNGPLHVMDLSRPNPLGAAFLEAAQQAGQVLNPDFNGARQEGVGWFQVTQKNGERYSAAKAYLSPSLNRPNLTVFTGAHTTRIVLEHKKAVGVEFVLNGQTQQLRCRREVLLCAGALQSPQVLMLSGIGPRQHLLEHGIAPLHDLPGVGENLHDHPDMVQVVNAPKAQDSYGLSLAGVVKLVRAIFEWRNKRSGLLTTNFAEAGGFVKSRPEEPRPDLQLHFVNAKLVNHGRNIVLGHGYSCHVCLLRPLSRGRVRLASKNPLDDPLIDFNLLGERDDVERLVRGFKLMRRVLQQNALIALQGAETFPTAYAQSDLEIEQVIREHADTVYHPAGSCRMGHGAMDVVDHQLRVHGLQGLRVVDASIMPSVVSGNTNAPTIMIAEKAADMIKAAQAT